MRRNSLTILVPLALVLVHLVSAAGVYACVGARPLAMGGAYVAMGDSNSVYWNPAGLTQIENRSAQATLTLNNRDYFNYDFFASYVEPDNGYGAGGLSVVIVKDLAGIDGSTGERLYDQEQWFVYSIGRKFTENLALGVNVRCERYGYDVTAGESAWGTRWALDAGLQAEVSDKLRLGLLLQDAAGTRISFQGHHEEGPGLNVRPGLAVFPDDKTTITFDLYDALDSFGALGYRVGAERWLSSNLAVRAGWDRGISTARYAWTAGLGWRQGSWSVDYVLLGGDLGNTHQLGVEISF